jgi:hypothetical protein
MPELLDVLDDELPEVPTDDVPEPVSELVELVPLSVLAEEAFAV